MTDPLAAECNEYVYFSYSDQLLTEIIEFSGMVLLSLVANKPPQHNWFNILSKP